MKITVEKKKKSVVVLDWGRAPFGVEESACRGKAFIPDGFTVETTAARRNWIAKTRVVEDAVQYRFIVKEDPTKFSEWKKSPTGAFKDINERIKNRHYTPGANGALFIGVTYPPIQKEITSRFGRELGLLQASNGKSHRSQRYDEPTEENQPIYGDEDKPRVKSPGPPPMTPEIFNKRTKTMNDVPYCHVVRSAPAQQMFEPAASDSAFFDGAIQDLELFFGKPESSKEAPSLMFAEFEKPMTPQPSKIGFSLDCTLPLPSIGLSPAPMQIVEHKNVFVEKSLADEKDMFCSTQPLDLGI
jgi:hypothetical protein